MGKPRVFVSRRIPAEGLRLLQDECECEIWDYEDDPVPKDRFWAAMKEADGALLMLTERVTTALLDQSSKCRVIANMAVGHDNIPLAECTARNIMVTNAPVAESIADLTFALMLATSRRLIEGHRVVLSGSWRIWSPMFLIGQDVFNATLGIVGMGNIGRAVAERAKGFHMKTLYYNRNRRPDETELCAEWCPLDDLLRRSDFVVTLAPLSRETYHMIGARELSLMKPTAVLVNTGRGQLIDEKALHQALADKRIWAAGLDVFEIEPPYPYHPLLQLENVLAVPHIGSASIADRTSMALQAANNLLTALKGHRPANLVNWDVWDRLSASGNVAATGGQR